MFNRALGIVFGFGPAMLTETRLDSGRSELDCCGFGGAHPLDGLAPHGHTRPRARLPHSSVISWIVFVATFAP
jgi:hypothetical protein